ncbi:MAG: hypothetical protein RJA52_278 [Bacteroidota bacterium]|jgi:hypothetical protein
MLKFFIPAMIIGLFSCTDPLTLGGNLIDEQITTVKYNDSIIVIANSVLVDSVNTYSPSLADQLNLYLFGDYSDPLFGRSVASFYVQPRPDITRPDFRNSTLDSIIFMMPYHPSFPIIGNKESEVGIRIHRIVSDLDRNTPYYSNYKPEYSTEILGEVNFTPTLDSIPFINFSSGFSDTAYFPHVSIPLDKKLGLEFMSKDSSGYESDAAFLDFFKGLAIIPTKASENLLGFNLSAANSGIYIYYTQDDTLQRRYSFKVNDFSVKMTGYSHDYLQSLLGASLNNTNDTLLYLQGMSGTDIELDLSGVKNLKNVIINKADLEIFVANHPLNDTSLFALPDQIVLSHEVDGVLLPIDDIRTGSQNIIEFFGGSLIKRENGEPSSYKMNITGHLQTIISNLNSEKLIVSIFPKRERATRALFYSSTHPQYGIKLRLAYTQL